MRYVSPDLARYILALLLLLLPLFLMIGVSLDSYSHQQIFKQLIFSLAFLFIPVFLFYKNLTIYGYLLLPLIIFSPFFIFSIYFFRLNPGLEMIAVIMQSNAREAQEASGSLLWYFVPFAIFYIGVYLYLLLTLKTTSIHFKTALMISFTAFFTAYGIIYVEKQLYTKPISSLNKYDLIKTYHYPVSLLTAALEARSILKKNNLDAAMHFKFGAYRADSIQQRQIHVLVIGESSRYDHWQVNGYVRETSPKLMRRKNLVSFTDVIAGAHYTWVSVPQIITRATPDNYNAQYREYSILKAYQEAGFKTTWLSNQSDKEIFWTGSIVLHAKTADFSSFSPTYSPNFEFENIYDERLLPLLDSVIHADTKNVFIVVHTMGNHWEYSRRYPEHFDFFKPSGFTEAINPPGKHVKQAIINSYDNSIRYADFVIDSIISIVEKQNCISSVTFISDHGEDLFDANAELPDFHFRPSLSTLKVPMFIWTSDLFNLTYLEKVKNLCDHKQQKIGTENFFYTIADLGNIRFAGWESKRSVASLDFKPSEQKFLGDGNQAVLFSQISVKGVSKK